MQFRPLHIAAPGPGPPTPGSVQFRNVSRRAGRDLSTSTIPQCPGTVQFRNYPARVATWHAISAAALSRVPSWDRGRPVSTSTIRQCPGSVQFRNVSRRYCALPLPRQRTFYPTGIGFRVWDGREAGRHDARGGSVRSRRRSTVTPRIFGLRRQPMTRERDRGEGTHEHQGTRGTTETTREGELSVCGSAVRRCLTELLPV